MKKSYKTVWNETTGTYMAATEVAKSRRKSSRNKTALVAALLAIGASMDASAGFVDGGTATGSGAIAVGPSANASGQNSIYIGGNTDGKGSAAGWDSVAIGTNTVVDENSAEGVALGRKANVTNAADGVAIGNESSVSAANAVALGAGSKADRANTVSVGAAGSERQIVNVAAGGVRATSTDAVNGSQLYSNAASTAAALGGGAKVAADGTISAPAYTVGGTTVDNVGAAISNLDGRVAKNTTDIEKNTTDIEKNTTDIEKNTADIADLNSTVVKYDSPEHDRVTLGGSADAQAVRLSNLQDGELSMTSTDAVTGAQLSNTNQNLADLTQSVKSAMSVNTADLPAPTSSGTNAVAFGGGAQASGDNSVAIGAGSVADQANTFSVGSQGNERRITNVADGQGPTDAVNMRQFQSGLGSVARNAYSGVAAATALTMIPEVDPGKTLAVGVAGGSYKGYQAMALGASARVTANLKVKIGAGISAADTTYGAGASYQW